MNGHSARMGDALGALEIANNVKNFLDSDQDKLVCSPLAPIDPKAKQPEYNQPLTDTLFRTKKFKPKSTCSSGLLRPTLS